MNIINLTPHSVDVVKECDFINLEKLNETTWVADGLVDGSWVASYPSKGVARISTSVENIEVPGLPGTAVVTKYGEATGIPEGIEENDVLIVSLPMQSMAVASSHPLAHQMAVPYKVVRLRGNTSTMLGCMGFTFQ